MKRIDVRVLTAAFVLFLAACTIQPRRKEAPPAPPSAQQELKVLLDNLEKKPTPQAVQKLKGFIAKYPQTDAGMEGLATLGEYYYKQKNFEEAYHTFNSIISSGFETKKINFAYYASIKSLSHLNRHDELLKLAEVGLKLSDLSPTYRLDMLRAQCRSAAMVGQNRILMFCLRDLNTVETDLTVVEQNRLKMLELVEAKLSEDDLKVVMSEDFAVAIKSRGFFRLGLTAKERGALSEAESFLNRAIGLETDPSMRERAQAVLNQIQARNRVDSKTIGAILPMTGKHEAIGNKSLRGILLGLGVYGTNRSDLNLAVIDNEGNADKARRAADELVLKDNVIGIIGSLLSKTSTAETSKSQEFGVPTISLSQKADLTEIGDFVFRNAATSRMFVRRLVDIAMNQKGLKKFAILFPNDAYGVEYANLFWDEVLARGGQVVAAQPYRSNETDFSGVVQRLAGTYYLEDRQEEYSLRVKEWVKKQKSISQRSSPPTDLLPPIVDFEAIFVPDGVKALGQIAPALAYHEIKTPILLGTNLWKTPGLVERGQKQVEGALLVDHGLNDIETMKKSRFYREFMATFGEEPTLFEAQAYEAALMFRFLLSRGYSSRKSLADGLREMSSFEGVLGPLQFNSSRELVPTIVGYTVKDGALVPL